MVTKVITTNVQSPRPMGIIYLQYLQMNYKLLPTTHPGRLAPNDGTPLLVLIRHTVQQTAQQKI